MKLLRTQTDDTTNTSGQSKAEFRACLAEPLRNVNFVDACFFDAEQYTDKEANNKSAAAKYFIKEATFIKRMVQWLIRTSFWQKGDR